MRLDPGARIVKIEVAVPIHAVTLPGVMAGDLEINDRPVGGRGRARGHQLQLDGHPEVSHLVRRLPRAGVHPLHPRAAHLRDAAQPGGRLVGGWRRRRGPPPPIFALALRLPDTRVGLGRLQGPDLGVELDEVLHHEVVAGEPPRRHDLREEHHPQRVRAALGERHELRAHDVAADARRALEGVLLQVGLPPLQGGGLALALVLHRVLVQGPVALLQGVLGALAGEPRAHVEGAVGVGFDGDQHGGLHLPAPVVVVPALRHDVHGLVLPHRSVPPLVTLREHRAAQVAHVLVLGCRHRARAVVVLAEHVRVGVRVDSLPPPPARQDALDSCVVLGAEDRGALVHVLLRLLGLPTPEPAREPPPALLLLLVADPGLPVLVLLDLAAAEDALLPPHHAGVALGALRLALGIRGAAGGIPLALLRGDILLQRLPRLLPLDPRGYVCPRPAHARKRDVNPEVLRRVRRPVVHGRVAGRHR
mmetsp:Transcript_58800/g.187703  ORF Transcript_58800/g.187703 Transcript_58800/m.187703 type:complete len:476 (-) Transcript_58800:277-1704(-)